MSYPLPVPIRDGKEVIFAPPRAVEKLPHRRSTVVASVSSGPHKDEHWGYYLYFSERIRWDDGSYSIRLAYYYAPFGSERWLWGGQYSIEDSPAIIKDLLEQTLRQTDWFADPA